MNKPIYTLIVMSLLLVASGCNHKPAYKKPETVRSSELSSKDMPTPGKPITILVHGTRLPFPLMAVPLLINQVTTPSGLYKTQNASSIYHFCRLSHLLAKYAPQEFPLENSYLYGWSGMLSFKNREKAGERLYHYLRHIRNDTRFDSTPITIITISHGANVALNIAKAAEKYHDKSCLVDRLVLLCGPVQDATDRFAAAPTFKQVFNIFSEGDSIQVADPQQLYDENELEERPHTFFSRRTFNTPSDHLIQASITWGKTHPGHVDFAMNPFQRKLSTVLDILQNESKRAQLPMNAEGIYLIDMTKLDSYKK